MKWHCWFFGHSFMDLYKTEVVAGYVIQKHIERRCTECGKIEKGA